jgi:hypothetical protein
MTDGQRWRKKMRPTSADRTCTCGSAACPNDTEKHVICHNWGCDIDMREKESTEAHKTGRASTRPHRTSVRLRSRMYTRLMPAKQLLVVRATTRWQYKNAQPAFAGRQTKHALKTHQTWDRLQSYCQPPKPVCEPPMLTTIGTS